MANTPNNGYQISEKSILDQFNKQTYLGNSYSVPVINVNLTTSGETNVVLLENPSTNTKALFVNLRRYSSSAEQCLVKVYVNCTVSTTSTATTPVNLRPASANTSSAEVYENGQFTTSANGTSITSLGCPADYYITLDSTLLIILDPGQNLLITSTATTANTLFNADISWYEL